MEKALLKLPADQSDTLRRRYYDGRTFQQTAAETGVYPETARQREKKALRAFVELRTNYFFNVSARTGERTVEVIALRREEMARRRGHAVNTIDFALKGSQIIALPGRAARETLSQRKSHGNSAGRRA